MYEASLHLDRPSLLHAHIERLAKRWKMPNLDAREILLEAISRGLRYIDEKERAIKNPSAWLRAVSTNIVRDEVKAAVRENKLQTLVIAEHIVDPVSEVNAMDEIEYSGDRNILHKAMAELSRSDQEILKYRFQESKRYKDIQADLISKGRENVTVQTLRKRESRALKRLREKFIKYKGQDC